MNQTQSYMDVHGSHLSASSTAIPNYHQYHHQPPVLQPASAAYGPASSYSQYAYPNGVNSPQSASQPATSSMTSQVSSQLLPLPAVTSHSVGPPGYGTDSVYDATGQLAPPGAKPRVTATLWEDEGSLCYQIEARGVCVARREDNHMINGTKLLNVAGMTRGRRDGILKSEKVRNVVKIGPMHLKGVWIPFERALDFANKEKITDLLYPLFVHQIAELLYHPTNSNQTNMVVQDSQQRRLEGPPGRTSQGPPPLHHHHPMQSHLPPHLSQPPNSLSSQHGGRPVLDRANSFPTPPASASSLMGISHQGGSYDWNNQGMNSGVRNSQPLSMDNTSLGNARSVPTTPATTPPGNGMQGMPPFQGQSAYDSSKPYYSAAPPSNSQYTHQPLTQPAMASYGQPSLASSSYLKSDMAPPGRSGGQPEAEVADVKGDRYNQSNGQAGESIQDHEPEYVHDDSSGYNSRGSYTYASNPSVGALTEQPQLTPDMTGSPSQRNSSGRMTPRTGGGPPSQWSSGYNTPPRAAAGSLYNIVSDTRGSSTNGAPSDAYGVGSNSTPGYSTGVNGSLGMKRLREDDEVDRGVRPDSRGAGYESKRRKTLTDPVGPVGAAPIALQPLKAGGVMARPR